MPTPTKAATSRYRPRDSKANRSSYGWFASSRAKGRQSPVRQGGAQNPDSVCRPLRFVEKGDDGGFATFAVRDEQVSFGRFRRQPAEPDAITVEILTRKRIGIFEALSRNHRRPGAQKRIPAGADLRTAANPIGSRPYAVAVVEKQRRTIGSILLPIDFGRFGKGPQFPPELRCSVPGIPTARQQSPQQQDTR